MCQVKAKEQELETFLVFLRGAAEEANLKAMLMALEQ
jgi:hypothetical protein